ncbi:hypothetical protein C882_1777 [Caenispirillum salinarum AK4]|uniref:RNA-binding protein AU-1/Ribonuclease E/G domain-containing protein n=1 Tax=Caenispirillum salinarum AK4 TaxID=1238182 RepID=K9GMP9_9PROT|nr:ribonuclease E/G [Caenispirillum salinarum]EKV27275.1 hypothetical protein C882_1777 [Caenispirillum salinarum AK4]
MPRGGSILVSDGPGESRAAILDDGGRLVALFLHRAHRAEAGSVHLGRVTGRLPDGSAAFVDIGEPDAAFLNAPDARVLGGLPAEGAAVVVQVRHAARRGKGARLTADVSFSTPLLAYGPLRPGVAASGKLAKDRAKALTALLRGLAEKGEGLVARTAAADAAPEALGADLARLRAEWTLIDKARATAGPVPRRLSPPPDLLAEALARWPEPDAIVFEGATVPAQARRRHPALSDIMEAARPDLFLREGADEQVEAALSPRVPLPCGGALVIEPTAALVAVDVDAGPAAPSAANAEAVAVLARQLEVRGLAGHVVVDFIPDRRDPRRRDLIALLKQALEDDPAAPYVAGVSPLGLVELSRRRAAPPLADLLCDADGRLSAETVALAALRRVLREAEALPGGAPVLEAAPQVIEALRGPLRAALAEAEARLYRPLTLRARDDLARDRVETVFS